MAEYNVMEMMIVAASRELEDGSVVAVGTGAPCAAAMLAQKSRSPNLVILFEAGGIDPQLPEMPITVGDSRTIHRASMAGSMADIMEACARGAVDYTFLGGAQIDMYGNLNSTLIGADYEHPTVRLPGSGGANDFASLCWRMMVITLQNTQRFVEKLDFMTSPGWLEGGDSRERAGLPPGSGPYRIITNLAVMDFEPESKRMRVVSIHPGYGFAEVQDNCAFELLRAERIMDTPPPSKTELCILREQVDPYGLIINR